MAILLRVIQRWIGLSTDTKPTAPAAGSTFYEANTGYSFVYNGYAWLPNDVLADHLTVNYNQISLNQAAASYTAMTATAQNVFMDAVIVHVPDDLSGVAVFTGISVETDDVAPVVLLSQADGVKANLTGNFYHIYRGPTINASTKLIQVTIYGATAGVGSEVDISTLWRPLVAGGYYLNA